MPEQDTTSSDAMIRFRVAGELPRQDYDHLVETLVSAGVYVEMQLEEPLVALSVLVEYLKGPDGYSHLAVTDDTVKEFLQSQGMDEAVAGSQAKTFMWYIEGHTRSEH
jgi:hypothetical protein